ncbi:uncharacterized protein [Miscanthus floridulus]|uniref:uncharacterized protein n=1 Tax=Miscanthus floridulus TaxID=154761 RepID=UPI00345A5294
MKLKLQARHLWDAVEFEDVEFDEDRSALDAICSAVQEDMVPALATKASAKEAWEAIRTLRIGDDRVRKATAQNLRAEYESIALREGEAIEDFALRLTGIVTGRLKAADDVEPAPAHTASRKLLLTEEQWVERYKKKNTESSRGGSSSGGRGKHRGHGRGCGTGGDGDTRASSGSGKARQADVCKNCGKVGHWAKDCRSKKKEEQVHVAQDDEPTLMLAVGPTQEPEGSFPFSAQPPAPPCPRSPMIHGDTVLHIVEQKVFATFDAAEDWDPRRWILDTGASNHMSGSRAAFTDLDTAVSGSVHYGDGSVAQIKGIGTVLLECKNGEHRSLPNVYYLPRLTANIISVGQLDKGGYQVLVEDGVMRIRDEDRHLLAKIPRNPSRLYVLDVTIARPVCLAARTNDDSWMWHARFGHINFTALRKMAREELVCGMPPITQVEQGEAVTTAVYLLNRSSSKSIGGKTPYELWMGSAPDVHHLRTFGCVAHVKNTTPNLKKLDDRSHRMIFIGYDPGSKAYRIYGMATRRVHISRNIIFDKAAQWSWASTHDVEPDNFTIEQGNPEAPEATPPGHAARDLEERLLLASDIEPTTFDQAMRHECWRQAMLDEMTSIEASGTWRLIEPPPHTRSIGLKWVYKAKKDASDIVTKHKARLVTKGYVQRQGIDFDEVFAPVVRLESVRLLLAHAASEGWPVHHMNMKSAFLNGELQEEVYVEQPPSFVL